MATADLKTHWDAVYLAKQDQELSWFQSEPALSLEWIAAVAAPPARVIDVGGGTSSLAARLLERGYRVSVLDISSAALSRAKAALGTRAKDIHWILADVTDADDIGQFDVWHDRAVFHFLTSAEARQKYVDLARRTIAREGHLIIATFAPAAPQQCSGLNVCRYDAQALSSEFGNGFRLLRSTNQIHRTPWNKAQEFTYVILQRT